MNGMRVSHTTILDLDQKTVDEIFRRRLSELTEGQWTRKGKLMEEVVTSHRFDTDAGDKTHPRYELVLAIETLETLLQKHELAGFKKAK